MAHQESMTMDTSLVDYPNYHVDFGLIDASTVDSTSYNRVFQESPRSQFYPNSHSRSNSSNYEAGSYQSGTSQLQQQQQKTSGQFQSNSSGNPDVVQDPMSTARMGGTSDDVSNWLQPRPIPTTSEEDQQPNINSNSTDMGSWNTPPSVQHQKQQTFNNMVWSQVQHASRNVNPMSPAGSVVTGGFSQGFLQIHGQSGLQPQLQEEMKHSRPHSRSNSHSENSSIVASTGGGDIQGGKHRRGMSITSFPDTSQLSAMQHRNEFLKQEDREAVPASKNVSRARMDYGHESNPAARFIRKSSPQQIPAKRQPLESEMVHTHSASGSWDAESAMTSSSPGRRGMNGFHSPLRELTSSPTPTAPPNSVLQQLVPQPAQPEGQLNQQERGLLLVNVLVGCADAVSKKNQAQAISLLNDLSQMVSPHGDAMQRVASYFTYGLLAHIANNATGSSLYRTLRIKEPTAVDTSDALQAFSNFCPFIRFGEVATLQTLLEAFQGEQDVQWIDLGMVPGSLWLPCQLLRGLANRNGGPPTMIHFTGVQVNSRDDPGDNQTSRQLKEVADQLHLNFIFQPVSVERLEELESWMLTSREGQAVAVNCSAKMHTLLYDDAIRLSNVLAIIHNLTPKVFCILEQEASHNVPTFLARFLEALHFYSAIFDSLEATLPRVSSERAKIEQLLLGQEIINIVGRDGKERLERHERWQLWRNRLANAGFRQWPHSEAAVAQVKSMREISYGTGFTVQEDRGSLILNWQDRPLFTSSAWTSA